MSLDGASGGGEGMNSTRWIRAAARSAVSATVVAGLGLGVLVSAGSAQSVSEPLGRTLEAPEPAPHQIWVSDMLFRRTAMVDADSGRFLGMLSAGIGVIHPEFSRQRGEIYLVETYYSRGSRGDRSDVVTIYDARKLAPLAEIPIPPKRAEHRHHLHANALLDDGRFLVVYNQTPATSVSVVDVEQRRFLAEIATPGCSLVYPAGPRRFAMLCGDGSALLVTLGDDGGEIARTRSKQFFDPQEDALIEKAARYRDMWIFVTYSGRVWELDVAGDTPTVAAPWSLAGDAIWRPGGTQGIAVHEDSGRLYVLMHRGGEGTHKDAGEEIWVFDIARQDRLLRIDPPNPLAAFLAQQAGLLGGWGEWALRRFLPHPGIDRIAVTQDAEPLLLAACNEAGAVAVMDALRGIWLRDLHDLGLFPGMLQAPWR
jgi:methylamine dehydrogenase heavy chain